MTRKKIEPAGGAAPLSLPQKLMGILEAYTPSDPMEAAHGFTVKVSDETLRKVIKDLQDREPVLGVSDTILDSWNAVDTAIDRVVTSLPCSLSENINKLVLEQFAFRRLIQQEAMKR